MQRLHLAFAAVAVAALTACSTPYSQLYGERYYKAPIDTYELSIVSVDDETFIREPARIDPGTRKITVRAAPTAAQFVGREQTITLNVKPCTRYFLVAVRPTPLSSDYTVKVDHEEPVRPCSRAG